MPSSVTFQVRVVDPSGAPVAAQLVQASARHGGHPWSAEVASGPDGVAEFTGAPVGPVTLALRSGQSWVSPDSGRWRQGGPGQVLVGAGAHTFELSVVPAAHASVRVLDELGRPVSGAAVLHGPREFGWSASAVTDGMGAGVLGPLEPGPARIGVVLSPGAEPRKERWVDAVRWVTLPAGASTAVDLAVRSAPTGAIACAARPGVELRLAHAEAPLCGRASAPCGADGRARFGGLQPGRYHLFDARSLIGPPVATVDVDDAEEQLALELPTRADLTVVVSGVDGRPIAGARVLSQAIPSSEQADGVTGADGSVRLGDVPLGATYLWVAAPGFLHDIATVEHDRAARRCVLRPARELVVRGRVPPVLTGAHVGIGVAADDGELRVAGHEETPEGRFERRAPVPPGAGGAILVRVSGKVPVVVPFGADATVVDLGELAVADGATARGAVTEHERCARGAFTWVEVRTAHHGTFHEHLRPDGTFEVRGIPQGEFEIYIAVHEPHPEDGVWTATLRLRADAEDLDVGLVSLAREVRAR